MSEGFFSRWSRRKQEAAQPEPVPPHLAPAAAPPTAPAVAVASPAAAGVTEAASIEGQAPLPTLDDTHALTPASDFKPFMQRGVGAEVRNAAMKKLFTDPHFNVMDGLDIYIDDYSQADPMPAGMLQKMASAQFLNLVPPEAPDPEVVAQSPGTSAGAEPPSHDDPDLQLQPDPAPADPPAEPGAR